MARDESSEAIARFFSALRTADRRVLLLDYDGTLAPFRVERSETRPYEGVGGLLTAIRAQGTRIVIVSGRAARDVARLAPLAGGVEIWGSHGWERLLPNGTYSANPLPPAAVRTMETAERWLLEAGLRSRMEKKPAGLAVHWRGLEPLAVESLRGLVEPRFATLAESGPVHAVPFDGGLELRPRGRDKGTVVEAILREEPTAAVAFLGDDLTDEDAFRVLKGKGLGVLVRQEPRPTAADALLEPPDGLLGFLTAWRDATAAPGR